jgi:hypothetical protein
VDTLGVARAGARLRSRDQPLDPRDIFLRDDFGDLFELANFGPREWLVAPAAGRMYLVRNSIYT